MENNKTNIIHKEKGTTRDWHKEKIHLIDNSFVYDSPGAILDSESHGNRSFESITLCSGNLIIKIDNQKQSISAGETIRFRTDKSHFLKNESGRMAHGFMVNIL